MLRVGLTGGIASGKSTVARRFATLGAVVIDSDLLAREVVAPGSDGLGEVVAAFGPGVLTVDRSLDRPALASVVFSDPDARARLEAITHPRIRALTEERFATAAPDAVVVHDIPLLVELGYEDRYHLVVVVHAEEQERVRRMVQERESSEADARRRIGAQADDTRRREAADVWLDNTGAPTELLEVVDRLWRDRLIPFEAGVREGRVAPAPSELSLVEAQQGWAATGRRLVARVRRAAAGEAVAVDHIGSTAVPGLAAKDVIDLQLVVPDLAVADRLAPHLAAAGLPAVPGEWTDTTKPGEPGVWDKRLHGSSDPGCPVHLHVRAAGTPGARYALLFRDWLRDDDEARLSYESQKRRLAELHPLRADYAAAKEPWFTDVAWARMQLWAAETGWTSPA